MWRVSQLRKISFLVKRWSSAGAPEGTSSNSRTARKTKYGRGSLSGGDYFEAMVSSDGAQKFKRNFRGGNKTISKKRNVLVEGANVEGKSVQVQDMEGVSGEDSTTEVRESFEERQKRKNAFRKGQERYGRLVQILLKKGDVTAAVEALDRMKKRRFRPDVVIYNSIIAGYGRKGDFKQAFKLFNELKKRGLLPTDRTYSSMFSACGAGGPQGYMILEKVRSEMERREVPLNTITSNALMSALALCGKDQEAIQVYMDMEKAGLKPDAFTFGGLLLIMSRDEEEGLKLAQGVWSEMRKSAVVPDLHCHNVLLQALRDGGLEGVGTGGVIRSKEESVVCDKNVGKEEPSSDEGVINEEGVASEKHDEEGVVDQGSVVRTDGMIAEGDVSEGGMVRGEDVADRGSVREGKGMDSRAAIIHRGSHLKERRVAVDSSQPLKTLDMPVVLVEVLEKLMSGVRDRISEARARTQSAADDEASEHKRQDVVKGEEELMESTEGQNASDASVGDEGSDRSLVKGRHRSVRGRGASTRSSKVATITSRKPGELRKKLEALDARTVYLRGDVTFELSRAHRLVLKLGSDKLRSPVCNVRWLEKSSLEMLFAYMKKNRVRPNIHTFHLLGHLTLDPAHLLVTMQERKVTPDAKSMVAMVTQQAKNFHNLPGAMALLEFSQGVGLDLGQAGYQAMAAGCISEEAGLILLEKMKDDGVEPGHMVLGTLIGHAVRDHSYEYLTALIRKMMHFETTPNNTMLEMLDTAASRHYNAAWQKQRLNGFKGFYYIWRNKVCPPRPEEEEYTVV